MPILIEIAAHTIESAVAAEDGGANRVELFSSPLEGGLTPSEGMIAVVRDSVRIDLQVMIRPRGGVFHYCDRELEAMLRDIAVAKRLGANGVVFGLVNLDGSVDAKRTRQLVDAARPLAVTFHRAFDTCIDLPTSLADLIACGIDRVLTSGGESNAVDGGEGLADLVRLAQNRIHIMAGGGIKPQNARKLVQRTGVHELHAGLRSRIAGPVRSFNRKVSFGPEEMPDDERLIVREKDVRQLVAELEGL